MNFFRNRDRRSLKIYGKYYGNKKQVLIEVLEHYKENKECSIAIWGAGLKGNAFLATVDLEQKYINYVFDVNEKKHNKTMTHGHKIVNYKNEEFKEVDVIFLMNSQHETEIAGMLRNQDMHPIIVNVDSIICGDLSTKEALELYNRRA